MPGTVRLIGLGPAGLDRLPGPTIEMLLSDIPVVVRTLEHPAAEELATRRPLVSCDDLYESHDAFEAVYAAIAERVLGLAEAGDVAYSVPGSVLVGERAAALIRRDAEARGIEVVIDPGESFLDLAIAGAEVDPFDRGLQILDAHELPEPLLLHVPTFVVQLDGPASLFAVRDGLISLLEADTEVVLLTDLGGPDEQIERIALDDLAVTHAGLRVSLFVDAEPPGWPGLVRTNSRLRRECPWDREQTHHSLAKHLLEEAHEVLDAIDRLPAAAPRGMDAAGYDEMQEELGDLLLQVVFHATLAAEVGGFGVEEVAETIRRKLVRRHPHVFGEVDAETADHVMANWEQSKRDEKGRDSLLDGVPGSMPALALSYEYQARAATAGFDWPDLDGVVAKVEEEMAEVLEAVGDPDAVRHEVGDLLFSAVNLARRLDVDPEQALRSAAGRFSRRFRVVEAGGTLEGASLEELDARWEAAKASEGE